MKNTKYPNSVEFEVSAPLGLISDPIMRIGGEKCTYQIPTYEMVKGVCKSIYWKPTFIWFIDEVKVMNQIKTEVRGVRTLKYNKSGCDLSYYTYLSDVRYKVKAHFEWNENRPDLIQDRNENKHHEIAKRAIKHGGRRDVCIGTRECQAEVKPCVFDDPNDKSFYDGYGDLAFGLMYHGITYPDEAYSKETEGKMTVNFWYPTMKNGLIKFPRPEFCPLHRDIRNASFKLFIPNENFSVA